VLVTHATPGALAAKRATSKIPIVITAIARSRVVRNSVAVGMGGSHGGQRSTRCPKNAGVLKEQFVTAVTSFESRQVHRSSQRPHSLGGPAKMAATNKCLARSNNSDTGAEATNKRPAARRNFLGTANWRDPVGGVSGAGLHPPQEFPIK
jgi:hypothetical protein